jgi:cytochrome c553
MSSARVGLLAVVVLVTAHGGAELAPSPARLSAQTVRTDPERVAFMQTHFGRVLTVHDAVIRGDLAAVKPAAAWLADHDPETPLPTGTATFVAAMKAAARRAANAETVLAAAIATASMLKTCGDCHRAAGTMPAAPQTPRPDLGGVVGHMLQHQTAADQMAQGLMIPSNTLWRTGTRGFQGAPLHPRALPAGAKLPASLMASEERIHQLASQALLAEDPGARAVFYGQILARCADCHAQHRTLWGPGPR